MASPIQLKNNAVGRLTSGVSSSDTTLTLVSGDGAKFPTLTGAQYFPATLIRASDSAVEIVKVTARSGDVLTVVRAQEGTTGLALLAGDRVELRFTAGTLTDEIARIETIADGAVADAAAAQADAAAAAAAAASAQTTANSGVSAAAAAQATADAALPKAGGTMTGDLTLSGSGRRIIGDFSNATHANRTLLKSSTVNGDGFVGAIPNGTALSAGFVAYGAETPTNAPGIQMALLTGNEARISAFALGDGTQPPLTFHVGGSERARIDTLGRFQFNSGYGSVATAFGCRAWVNFNGTGTLAIRASGNVSSITDHGVGDYTVNFTTAMPDANYAAVVSGGMSGAGAAYGSASNANGWSITTTSSVRINTRNTEGYLTDSDTVMVAIFR